MVLWLWPNQLIMLQIVALQLLHPEKLSSLELQDPPRSLYRTPYRTSAADADWKSPINRLAQQFSIAPAFLLTNGPDNFRHCFLLLPQHGAKLLPLHGGDKSTGYKN
jgi:hypothetical protein